MTRIVYTVGYGKMLPSELLALAKGLDATVVDVRGKPVSRRAGFGRNQLEALLGERYTWLGDKLGGEYHLANARAKWPAGVKSMMRDVKRPLMLCQCHSPKDCHRHQVADVLLKAHDATVIHIFEHEAFEAHEFERSIIDEDQYDCTEWCTPRDIIKSWE